MLWISWWRNTKVAAFKKVSWCFSCMEIVDTLDFFFFSLFVSLFFFCIMQRSQSFSHLSPDTAFEIRHDGNGIAIMPVVDPKDDGRPSWMNRLFRSNSIPTAMLHDPVYPNHLPDEQSTIASPERRPSFLSRSTAPFITTSTEMNERPPSHMSFLTPSTTPTNIETSERRRSRFTFLSPSSNTETNERPPSRISLLSPTTTTHIDTGMSERRPSRFSFLSPTPTTTSNTETNERRPSRLSFLSRPPSYKRYTRPDQEARQADDMEALRQLEHYYALEQQQKDGGLLHQLLWLDPQTDGDRLPLKTIWCNCLMYQFTGGVAMAFWVLVLVFVGAISVFVPSLPPVAKLLWLPLVLYCVGVVVLLGGVQWRRQRHMANLEHQVALARQRRVDELLQATELPNDHYFVVQQRRAGRPVMTLIPPPPTYHNSNNNTSLTIDIDR